MDWLNDAKQKSSYSTREEDCPSVACTICNAATSQGGEMKTQPCHRWWRQRKHLSTFQQKRICLTLDVQLITPLETSLDLPDRRCSAVLLVLPMTPSDVCPVPQSSHRVQILEGTTAVSLIRHVFLVWLWVTFRIPLKVAGPPVALLQQLDVGLRSCLMWSRIKVTLDVSDFLYVSFCLLHQQPLFSSARTFRWSITFGSNPPWVTREWTSETHRVWVCQGLSGHCRSLKVTEGKSRSCLCSSEIGLRESVGASGRILLPHRWQFELPANRTSYETCWVCTLTCSTDCESDISFPTSSLFPTSPFTAIRWEVEAPVRVKTGTFVPTSCWTVSAELLLHSWT